MTKKRTIQSSVSRKEGRRQVALGTWCVDLAHNGAEERPHNLDAAAALQAAVGKDLVGVECTPPTLLSAERAAGWRAALRWEGEAAQWLESLLQRT